MKNTYFRSYQHIDLYSNKRVTSTVQSRGRQRNCFDTEKESIEHYNQALAKATAKAQVVMTKLKDLMKEEGFEICYEMDGDTHGIHLSYQYIDIPMDGYNFRFKLED